jgi:hypothetical protein
MVECGDSQGHCFLPTPECFRSANSRPGWIGWSCSGSGFDDDIAIEGLQLPGFYSHLQPIARSRHRWSSYFFLAPGGRSIHLGHAQRQPALLGANLLLRLTIASRVILGTGVDAVGVSSTAHCSIAHFARAYLICLLSVHSRSDHVEPNLCLRLQGGTTCVHPSL